MKILILDMDGVVNSNDLILATLNSYKDEFKKNINHDSLAKTLARERFNDTFCNKTELVFPELASKISEIVEKTGCSIVWSSSWRTIKKYKNIQDARKMFDRRGLPGKSLIGYTPDYSKSAFYVYRYEEINSFIKNYNRGDYLKDQNNSDKIEKVAILDDLDEAGCNLSKVSKFFKTEIETGITDDIKNNIIKYFNED